MHNFNAKLFESLFDQQLADSIEVALGEVDPRRSVLRSGHDEYEVDHQFMWPR